MTNSIEPSESLLNPKMWILSDEETPNLLRSVSVSIGRFLAVTSARGYFFDMALMLFLSRGEQHIILNTLPSPSRQSVMSGQPSLKM